MSKILRVPRYDQEAPNNSIVALNITSTGSNPLDLKLVGTEGESPYVFALRQKHCQKLKVSNTQADDEEWQQILNGLLVTQAPDEIWGVEIVVSELLPEKSVTLTVRKNIEGITSRMGTITLVYKEDQEIDPIEWIGISSQETTDLRLQLSEQSKKQQRLEETVEALQKQIADFTKLTQEHETDLLRNFQSLLNSKKAKIRDQQRLLASASVDPEALARVSPERNVAAGSSRAAKRKANVQLEDEESDEFEKMDVDGGDARTGAQEDSQADSDDEVTASEAEDEDDVEDAESIPSTTKKVATATAMKPKQTSTRKTRGSRTAPKTIDEEDLQVPPRRELPFQQKPSRPTTRQQTAVPEGKEMGDDATASEEDDEEL